MKIAHPSKNVLVICLALAVSGFAIAADQAVSDGTADALPDSATTNALAESETAKAPPGDGDDVVRGEVTVLVGQVSESAGRLQGAVERFSQAMEAAGTQDVGMRALDEMLNAARGVNESLNKDSQVWGELEALITTWSTKRDSTIERARTNPGLQPLAERWQEKINKAVELRTAILDQAADSEVLLEDIENKKEIIAEYYELDAIDQVLAEMQVMSDELTTMNASMQEILNKTVGVQEGREAVTN